MTDHPTPPDDATQPDQWEAIARFLAGEGSAADSAETRQWLIDHPNDAGVVAALEKLLPAPTPARATASPDGAIAFGRPIDVESALSRVHAQMETARTPAPLSVVAGGATGQPTTERPALTVGRSAKPPRAFAAQPRKRSWGTSLMGAAAVLIGAVGLIQGRSRPEPPATVAAVTHTSRVGSSDSITLSDGSKVILAAGSRLVVAENYGQGQRNVELQGEGRFTVTHDEARPFQVRMGNAVIRDLGTVFTVKSVGNTVVVAVTEGSVHLADSSKTRQDQAVDLKAGDRGRLLADGAVVAERGVVTPDDAGWVVGKITYRDASWAEVQSDLKRWYGVELVIADSALRTMTVSSPVLTSESIQTVATKLAFSFGASVSIRGDSVFIDNSTLRSKR